jgi:hypothetical protein
MQVRHYQCRGGALVACYRAYFVHAYARRPRSVLSTKPPRDAGDWASGSFDCNKDVCPAQFRWILRSLVPNLRGTRRWIGSLPVSQVCLRLQLHPGQRHATLLRMVLENDPVEVARRGAGHTTPVDNYIDRCGDGLDPSKPRDPAVGLRGSRCGQKSDCYSRDDAYTEWYDPQTANTASWCVASKWGAGTVNTERTADVGLRVALKWEGVAMSS